MYRGRFAPSPTGPLHAGSLATALASWLDARAHAGRWLVRIEDLDGPRCPPGAADLILRQLAACGLLPDEAPLMQSERGALYQAALARLQAMGLAYPCACSRQELEASLTRPAGTDTPSPAYPGTCRAGLNGRNARAWRLRTDWLAPRMGSPVLHWPDRRLGWQQQHVEQVVGDFVVRRADGWWAYQLAVVVDDAAQGISHVVRGEDLADSTARQMALQHALGLPQPAYLHTPLVRDASGAKLSKHLGAAPLALENPLVALHAAARVLGLAPAPPSAVPEALAFWVSAWAAQWRNQPRAALQ